MSMTRTLTIAATALALVGVVFMGAAVIAFVAGSWVRASRSATANRIFPRCAARHTLFARRSSSA